MTVQIGILLPLTSPSDWVGNWHQIAGTYDGTALKVYYDGRLMNTNNGSFNIHTNSYDLGIGIDLEHNRTVDGEISLARIYNRALTAEELRHRTARLRPLAQKMTVWSCGWITLSR